MLDPDDMREGARCEPEHYHQLGSQDKEGLAEHADYQRSGAAREGLRPGRRFSRMGQLWAELRRKC